MPFIIDEAPYRPPRWPRGRSAGAARPGGVESLIIANGIVLNNQDEFERYYVKSVEGLFGADIRDQREPKVNQDGEDVYDTLLGGKTVTISGKIEAWTLDSLRDMEQALEAAFPHNFDYPVVFDRSALRQTGLAHGALADNNLCLNPSFEVNTTGWDAFPGKTLARATGYFVRPNAGDYWAEVTWTNAGTLGQNQIALTYDGALVATQSQYMQYAIDVFIPDDWDGDAPTIDGIAAASGGASSQTGPVTALSNPTADLNIRNRWQRIWATYQWTNAADAASATMTVRIVSLPSVGRKLMFDAASIRVAGTFEDSKPTFFDGESPGWKWDGSPWNSASRPDGNAYRQDVFIMARRIDKIGLRDEQTSNYFVRDFQIPLRMADPCIYGVKTKTVQSVAGATTTIYTKNHGNYMASPRLAIVGPWTNFNIWQTPIPDGEDVSRRLALNGDIPAGVTFYWDEEEGTLVDSVGNRREGMVDSTTNGFQLRDGTNAIMFSGTGLTGASQCSISYEDTWK